MQTRITVNGEEYGSVDDMPPAVRKQYDEMMKLLADRDGNGVPDIFEGRGEARGNANVTTIHTSKVVLNGKEVNDLTALPQNVKHMLAETMSNPKTPARLNAGGDGFTIHLSGTVLLALVAALAVTGLILWMMR